MQCNETKTETVELNKTMISRMQKHKIVPVGPYGD